MQNTENVLKNIKKKHSSPRSSAEVVYVLRWCVPKTPVLTPLIIVFRDKLNRGIYMSVTVSVNNIFWNFSIRARKIENLKQWKTHWVSDPNSNTVSHKKENFGSFLFFHQTAFIEDKFESMENIFYLFPVTCDVN